MSAPKCVDCANEQVLKVSAVYDAGTWSATSSGYRFGWERNKQGKPVMRARPFTETTSGKTRLASLLAPPERPFHLVLFLVCVLSGLLLCTGWFLAAGILNELVGDPMGRWLATALVATVAAYGFFPVWRFVRWQNKRYEARVAQWEQAMKKWEALYYCERCDRVFNPETGRSAPTRAMRSLL